MGGYAKIFIILALGFVYFTFLFDDNLFYLIIFGVYIYYMYVKKSIIGDTFNYFLVILFLLFSIIILGSNISRLIDMSIMEFSGRDWRILIHPLISVMILDAVYSLSRYYKIRIRDVAIVFMLAILTGLLLYAISLPSVELEEMFAAKTLRKSFLVVRNVNLADDVYFFLSCSLLAAAFYLRNRLSFKIAIFAVSAAVIALFLVLVIQGQSRGAWLGIICGIAFVLASSIYYRRFLVPLLALIAIITIATVNINVIAKRLSTEGALFSEILDQWRSQGTLDISKLDSSKKSSTFYRLEAYENAWVLFKLKPWFGHGGFDTEKLKPLVPHKETLVHVHHSHNILMDVTLRQGIGVGIVYLALIFLPIVLLLRLVNRRNKDTKLYYCGSIFLAYSIYVLIENMFDLSFIRSDPGVRILYMLMAWCGLLLAEDKQMSDDSNQPVIGQSP